MYQCGYHAHTAPVHRHADRPCNSLEYFRHVRAARHAGSQFPARSTARAGLAIVHRRRRAQLGARPQILSGDVERGSAFVTRAHSGIETTWIVADYRPAEGRVSYARLAQGSNIGLVDVVCTAAEGGGTVVSVRYTLTGVSDSGRAFVREFLEPTHYARMIDEWQAATSSALAGKPVSH